MKFTKWLQRIKKIETAKRALNWRTILLFLLFLFVLLVFFIFLFQNANHYKQLFKFSITALAELVGLVILTILLNGLGIYTLCRGLGADLTLNEGIGLAAINSLGNQLPFPAGGLLITSVYLKRLFFLGYSRYLSAAVAFYVLSLTASGLIGLTVLTYWGLVEGIKIPVILLLGFLGMSASLLVLLLPMRTTFIPDQWKQQVDRALDGWRIVRKNRWLVVKMLVIQLVLMIVYAIELYISFRTLSQGVTLAHCILFSAANILTQLTSISPDALGVREAIIAGIAGLLGFDLGASIIAVGLVRLVVFPMIIVTGSLYIYILSNKNINGQLPQSSKKGE